MQDMVDIECSHCHRILPRSDFPPSYRAGGWCRACHNSTRRDKRAGLVPARVTDVCLVCGVDIRHMRRHAKCCSGKCSSEFWRMNNPEYQRNANLKSVYGITEEQFQKILVLQNMCCAICGTPRPKGNGWQVDHCHDTGKVRGILCPMCNQGLGMFKDNIKFLESAIRYLRSSSDLLDNLDLA